MIKLLNPGLARIGKIVIGEKGERAPVKFDHFVIKSLYRDKQDRLMVDQALMDRLGDKPTSLKIRLPFNDVEMNFPNNLRYYRGARLFCQGDGETAQRLKVVKTFLKEGKQAYEYGPPEPFGPCGEACPDFQSRRCRPFGMLRCVLEEQQQIGGIYEWRTTSYNSIRNVLAALTMIKAQTGGQLAWIPLTMRLVPQTVTPREGTPNTAYIVQIIYDGSPQHLLTTVRDLLALRAPLIEEIRALETSLRALPPAEDPPDEQRDTAEEFYPDNTEDETPKVEPTKAQPGEKCAGFHPNKGWCLGEPGHAGEHVFGNELTKAMEQSAKGAAAEMPPVNPPPAGASPSGSATPADSSAMGAEGANAGAEDDELIPYDQIGELLSLAEQVGVDTAGVDAVDRIRKHQQMYPEGMQRQVYTKGMAWLKEELARKAEASAATTEAPDGETWVYASPEEIQALKGLASDLSEQALMDVEDMLNAHPEGLVKQVYDIVHGRLKGQIARKAEAAAVPPEAATPAAAPAADKPKGKKAEDPLAKMTRAQIESAGAQLLKAMSGDGPDWKTTMQGWITRAWGVKGWSAVTGLPLSKLKMGLATLQALSHDASGADADDDVPDFPSAEPVVASGSDVAVPVGQSTEVQTSGEPGGENDEILPPESPQLVNGYIDPGDSETLRLWAEGEGHAEAWEDITGPCKRDDAGRRILTADQYRRVRNVVLFNREKPLPAGAA